MLGSPSLADAGDRRLHRPRRARRRRAPPTTPRSSSTWPERTEIDLHRRPGPPARRSTRCAALCGLVALVVYLLQGFDGLLSRDLAVYSYGGQQVAEGVAPFVAILNRAGPLAHLVPGVGAWVGRLVGVDDVLAMRVTLMLVAVATIVVIYLLGRDLFRSRGAGVAAAAAMLCCEGFLRYATLRSAREDHDGLPARPRPAGDGAPALGHRGRVVALSTLSWQPVAFPAIAALRGGRAARRRRAGSARWCGSRSAGSSRPR